MHVIGHLIKYAKTLKSSRITIKHLKTTEIDQHVARHIGNAFKLKTQVQSYRHIAIMINQTTPYDYLIKYARQKHSISNTGTCFIT